MNNRQETIGLRLYKPNYKREKRDRELCNRILRFDDEDGFNIIIGKFMPKQEICKESKKKGLKLIEDQLQCKYLQKIEEAADSNLRKKNYPITYLLQITDLLSKSKNYKNYYCKRKALSPDHTQIKSLALPMILSPRIKYNTRNKKQLPKAFSQKNIFNKNTQEFFTTIQNNDNSNIKKKKDNRRQIILPNDDEYIRFGEPLEKRKDKIIKRLQLENNFFQKNNKISTQFELDKEKLFSPQYCPKKSYYLKNEYFKSRTPFIKMNERFNMKKNQNNTIDYELLSLQSANNQNNQLTQVNYILEHKEPVFVSKLLLK